MAAGNVIRVQARWATNRYPGSFLMYYRQISSVPTNDDTQNCAEAFSFKMTSFLRGIMSGEAELTEVLTHKMGDPGIPGQVLKSAQPGLRPGEALPSNKALVISLYQSVVPARHNGRIYVGGESEDDQDGNVWEPSFLSSNVSPLVTTLKGNIDDGSPAIGEYEPVVWVLQNLPFDPANVHPITDVVAKPQVYSQARRTGRSKIIQTVP